MEAYADQLIATLLLSLRIAPTLTFAPPFTLLRTPALVRVCLSIALAAWMTTLAPAGAYARLSEPQVFAPAFATELLLGIVLAIALQLAYAAILTAGRVIDFQVGFGLALIADPTLRTQMPLTGTLFAYAAGAIFFTTSGPSDLLAIWAQSAERFPIGEFALAPDLSRLLGYIATIFVMSMGLGGVVLLTLFLTDLAVAFMSRTLPQMNVQVLGFQVKTLALLATLPIALSVSGALFLRIVRTALDATPLLL
jgi:flagellar biosynthetic protein FliR